MQNSNELMIGFHASRKLQRANDQEVQQKSQYCIFAYKTQIHDKLYTHFRFVKVSHYFRPVNDTSIQQEMTFWNVQFI